MRSTFPLLRIHEATARIPVADPVEAAALVRVLDAISAAGAEGEPQPPGHIQSLELAVPLIEALLDEEPYDVPHELLAQLVVMCLWPTVTDHMVLQIAFGRSIGEAHLDELFRIVNRAERRGLSIDDFVQQAAAAGGMPSTRTTRMFRGESRRRPDAERMRRGETLLLRAASLVDENLRPHLLSGVAWLEWAQGDRDRALAYLAAATRIAPGHPLAIGLAVHLARVRPEWLSRKAGTPPPAPHTAQPGPRRPAQPANSA